MSLLPASVERPPVAPPLPTQQISPFQPIPYQIPVLYIAVIFLVLDVALWHLPGVRVIINPFKLLAIGWHELCHIFVALITGGEILSVTIDPNLGGCTRVQGGHPPSILSAGYLGSTLFGAGCMIGGWDILAAKVISFVIAIALVAPLVLVRDLLTIILTIIYEVLLIGFWFIDHGSALRWYCLFVGVMNVFFALWDFLDDRYFKKANDSDCTQFSLIYKTTKPHQWAIGWITLEVLVFVGFLLIGVTTLKRTEDEMFAEAATFLPT